MKQLVMTLWFLPLLVLAANAQAPEAALTAAIETYDSAFKNKDVETIKTLLAPEILLYEHSVRNDGLQDVFENHLKPEILEFEDLQLDFSDVRITPGLDFALLTRQYRIRGRLRGREINGTGNETMGCGRRLQPDGRSSTFTILIPVHDRPHL